MSDDLLDDASPLPGHPRVPPPVSSGDTVPLTLQVSQEYRTWLDREAARLDFIFGGHRHAQDVVLLMLELWRERIIGWEEIPGQYWESRGWRA